MTPVSPVTPVLAREFGLRWGGVKSSEAIGVRQLETFFPAQLAVRTLAILTSVAVGVFLGRAVYPLGGAGFAILSTVFCTMVFAQMVHRVTLWFVQRIPLRLRLRSELPVLRVYQKYSGMVWSPLQLVLQCMVSRSCGVEAPQNGLVVYDSSVVLSALMASDKKLLGILADACVLELGAGVGAVTLALAQLGAKRIVATDIEPAAICAIQRNMKANEFEDRCSAQCFAFGDEVDSLCKAGKFDLIVSVDTIYAVSENPEMQEQLAQSLMDCCTPQGMILLAFEPRDFVWAKSELFRRLLQVFDSEELKMDGLHSNGADKQSAWKQFLEHTEHGWLRADSKFEQKAKDCCIILLRRRPREENAQPKPQAQPQPMSKQ